MTVIIKLQKGNIQKYIVNSTGSIWFVTHSAKMTEASGFQPFLDWESLFHFRATHPPKHNFSLLFNTLIFAWNHAPGLTLPAQSHKVGIKKVGWTSQILICRGTGLSRWEEWGCVCVARLRLHLFLLGVFSAEGCHNLQMFSCSPWTSVQLWPFLE